MLLNDDIIEDMERSNAPFVRCYGDADQMHSKLPMSALSLAKVLGESPDCVKLIDSDGRLLWMNENGLCSLEIDNFDSVCNKDWQSLWPEDGQSLVKESLPKAIADGKATFSAPCPTSKGAERWWDVAVHPIHDDGGTAVGFISISRDVTERENHRIALETMMAEMRHRLKNSYTMFSSLARSLSRNDDQLRGFVDDLQHRVIALANAQSLFDGDADLPELELLLESIVGPFAANSQVKLTINVNPNVTVDRRMSDAIALMVGEFAVNSTKYGAMRHGGSISITTRLKNEQLVLLWSERSQQDVVATSRDGSEGLPLIDRMLKANRATLELTWEKDGLDASASFSRGFSPV
jgi:PAS domain S-box-containing protein